MEVSPFDFWTKQNGDIPAREKGWWFFSFHAGWHFFGGTPINSCQSYAKDTILGAQSHVDKEVEKPLGSKQGIGCPS